MQILDCIPEDTIYKLPPLEDVVYDALINSELIKISHNVVAISKDKIKNCNEQIFTTN